LLKTLGEERRWCVDQKTENPFGRPITKQQTFQYVDSREAKTLSVAASDDNSETELTGRTSTPRFTAATVQNFGLNPIW